MTRANHVAIGWPVALGAAILFVVLGAVASYIAFGPNERGLGQAPMSSLALNTPDAQAREPVVSLSEGAITRVGIAVSRVESVPRSTVLRLPAVVEPNAYKRVTVTPLVSGRVTRVLPDLGARVRQGQVMATIFSPELADAETRYVSSTAELAAHERELARTEKLVQLGSASRQELERIHAEHTAQRTTVDSARSRLELLGISREMVEQLANGQRVDAQTEVTAPLSGVVTERLVNSGQNVESSTPLFTIVDLSSVWVVGSVYESDFSRVRLGDRAAITFPAYPGLRLTGTVSYMDPQVTADTRTAQLRVEIANPRQELRLGMLAEASIEGAVGAPVATVPSEAVQTIGSHSFVYVLKSGSTTQFVERGVTLGASSSGRVEVVSGLEDGESVVTAGSFFLRAERERLGFPSAAPPVARAAANAQRGPTPGQSAKIEVSDKGFEPADVKLKAGVAARLTFVRTTDKTCATEVMFPALKIKRALPLNQPVDIDFIPARNVDASFACGMNMFKGAVVVVD